MKDILTYKNYIAAVHFSTEDDVFYGHIEGIGDLVSFEGQSVQELKDACRCCGRLHQNMQRKWETA
jgi:predicted HicB family RNase H-like nuclease